MYDEEQELNIHPEYQRGFVWDKQKSSKLILTILSGRLVPEVILHEKDDESYDVVDGKQRLTSVLTFVLGKDLGWKKAPVVLTLPAAEDGDDELQLACNGKSFKELPVKAQKAFKKFIISVKIIEKDTDHNAVFEVYEDINSGGVNCTEQQLRKSVFYGPYMRLLDTLCRNPKFLKLLGQDKPDDEKELDRGYVLRFFAMKRSMQQYGRARKAVFLNNEIAQFRNLDDGGKMATSMEKEFLDVVDTVLTIFGDNAFKKYSTKTQKYDTKFSAPLYDTVMVGISRLLEQQHKKHQLVRRADDIREGFQQLFDDRGWMEAVGFTRKGPMLKRQAIFDAMLQRALRGKLPASRRPNRSELKEELFARQKQRCSLCGSAILNISDAEIDHIVPIKLGGSDDESNKQLLHRICNRAKAGRAEEQLRQEGVF